jgi:group I intron endonuclease
MHVYKITNNINGHGYVGITVCSIKKRWREHLCAARTGNGKRLYRAMRKYGAENFSIAPLCTAETFEELQVKEIALIALHKTHAALGTGYNLTSGGEGRDRVDQLFGTKVYNSVLTEELVAYIRSPENLGKSNKVLVAEVQQLFGVTCANDTLRDARRGSSWTHLDDRCPPVHVGQGSNKSVSIDGRERSIVALRANHAEAICKSAQMRKGKRPANAKLSIDQVKGIFYSTARTCQIMREFSVSKPTVYRIKKRTAHTYITKELT